MCDWSSFGFVSDETEGLALMRAPGLGAPAARLGPPGTSRVVGRWRRRVADGFSTAGS